MGETVEINSGNYSVIIGNLEQGSFREFLLSRCPGGEVFVLVDEHTRQACLPAVTKLLEGDIPFTDRRIISVPTGERHKTMRTVESVAGRLSDANASRDAVLLNLGGGVVCDLGGFAASVYKRGIDFINVPTTLLAQADAAVGGKTGVNLGHLKNYLGVFNNPVAVFTDTRFLLTLDPRELRAGYAEVIKHGLIADKEYLEMVKSHEMTISAQSLPSWNRIVEGSVRIKTAIVDSDPCESGERKALNFGHTAGHALESLSLASEDPLLHGEAVAIGMICELYLSSAITGLQDSIRDETSRFIRMLFPHRSLDKAHYNDVITTMLKDKKNTGGINFTLIENVGAPVIDQEADLELIRGALDYYNEP